MGRLLIGKSRFARFPAQASLTSVRVSDEFLNALTYFVALLRAIFSSLAVSVLLKKSSTLNCNNLRILFAGMGSEASGFPFFFLT